MKLYELTEQYQQLLDLAEHAQDDDEAQAFADTLEALGGELAEKLDNCACVAQTLKREAEAVKAEEDRLALRRKALVNSGDRLKAYMQDSMNQVGLRKSKGERFTVGIQANPARVVLDDETQLPESFWAVKRTPDTAQVRDALKGGQEVPGAHLEQGESLRIR